MCAFTFIDWENKDDFLNRSKKSMRSICALNLFTYEYKDQFLEKSFFSSIAVRSTYVPFQNLLCLFISIVVFFRLFVETYKMNYIYKMYTIYTYTYNVDA